MITNRLKDSVRRLKVNTRARLPAVSLRMVAVAYSLVAIRFRDNQGEFGSSIFLLSLYLDRATDNFPVVVVRFRVIFIVY